MYYVILLILSVYLSFIDINASYVVLFIMLGIGLGHLLGIYTEWSCRNEKGIGPPSENDWYYNLSKLPTRNKEESFTTLVRSITEKDSLICENARILGKIERLDNIKKSNAGKLINDRYKPYKDKK